MAYMTVNIESGMVDPVYGNCQVPLKRYMLKQAEAFEAASVMKQLIREERSKHWAEGYSGETAMDNFEPVGEGGAYPRTGFQSTKVKTIKNETWKQSFIVTEELLEDEQLSEASRRARNLVAAYNRTREMFVRQLYVGGLLGKPVKLKEYSFDTTTADGKPLFDKEHTNQVDKKKQSNRYAGELTTANFDAMETRMQNTVGENGELLAIVPDTIWIPNDADMKRKVFEIIGSEKDPETSQNGFNYQLGRWNVICDPYLTMALQQAGSDLKPWIMLDSNFIQMQDGAIFQNRVPLNVKSVVDETTDDNIWKGRTRFSGGFVNWRFAAAGGIAGGTALA